MFSLFAHNNGSVFYGVIISKKYFCRACWHDAIARTRKIAIKQNKAQFCNIANMLMVFVSFEDKHHRSAEDLPGDGSSTF